MTIRIEPMRAAHLDGATDLLATRQRAARQAEPALPEGYDSAGAVRPLIEAALGSGGAVGVVALDGGRPVGFAIGRPILNRPLLLPRPVAVAFPDHATAGEDGGEIYRALYAAIAASWVAQGHFSHYVFLPATDRAALAAWRSLGFGLENVRGLRDLAPLAGPAAVAGIELREAGEEDADEAARLLRHLALHHVEPPVLEALVPEDAAVLRAYLVETIADPAAYVLLAVRGGRAVGFVSMTPPSAAPLLTPPRGIELSSAYVAPEERGTGLAALLVNGGLAWARERGYTTCLIGWRTANLGAARFWTRAGFRPVLYRLSRHLDRRIAWARPAR